MRSGAADPCDRCASWLTKSRDLQQKDGIGAAIESACKVICEKSHRSERHKKLRDESVKEILAILDKSYRPGKCAQGILLFMK